MHAQGLHISTSAGSFIPIPISQHFDLCSHPLKIYIILNIQDRIPSLSSSLRHRPIALIVSEPSPTAQISRLPRPPSAPTALIGLSGADCAPFLIKLNLKPENDNGDVCVDANRSNVAAERVVKKTKTCFGLSFGGETVTKSKLASFERKKNVARMQVTTCKIKYASKQARRFKARARERTIARSKRKNGCARTDQARDKNRCVLKAGSKWPVNQESKFSKKRFRFK
ncbi:hypothetical protein E3N88_19787 [Mikania micrantha]|uniref:Uncharacterized protein n=1 Tax=Mikania micrantha TaxID=192012 RepID=A0A5N6NPG1_9ASTR|nr:hypothetical protein E3N88_19787 [Mikania micrantha]